MKQVQKTLATTLALLMLTQQMSVMALAVGETPVIPSNSSEAVLNAAATTFNVTLPTVLPIDVDANNVVTVATDVTLQNNSTGPIKVNNIAINERNSWVKVTTPSNKAGLKEFNLDVSTALEAIPANSNTAIVYTAQVSPQKQSTSETIADVVFTVGWDEKLVPSTSIETTDKFSLAPGETRELTFKFSNVESDVVTWTSSNESVATVVESTARSALISGEKKAVVTAVGIGKANITGTLPDGTKSSLEIDIQDAPAEGDVYEEGNYRYTYRTDHSDGWEVSIMDNTQTHYVQPLETIRNKPVTRYTNLFKDYPNSELVLDGTWSNNNVTFMSSVFQGCKATTLNLSNFNTHNVDHMDFMFYKGEQTTIDLSNFDTSKVLSMACMFAYNKATTLDISNFDTSNVVRMYEMFFENQATTLDVSNFDASKLSALDGMFYNCKATTIDLSNFNTTNVESMGDMFNGCAATTLDLSSFDTSSVTYMGRMFENNQATYLDLSSFDTSGVTDMNSMFRKSAATTLDLSSFDNSNVTTMGMFYIFSGCKATTGYARTQADADKFNGWLNRPETLTFIVKP